MISLTDHGWSRTVAMALVVTGNLVYHLAQKAVPRSADPALVLLVAYAVAALVCLGILLGRPGQSSDGLRSVGWSSLVIGFGIVAIELGFLLAYRSGWPIGSASLTGNVSVALVLLPVGLIGFGESLTPTRVIGAVLCLIGLWCVTRG